MNFWKIYKPYYLSNIKIALPLMLSQLGQVVVQQADIMMVGRLQEPIYLAAVSFANSVFFVVMVFGMGIAYGVTPIVAQTFVSNNAEKTGGLFKSSFVLNLGMGIVLTIILWTLSYFMKNMGQDPEVCALAVSYYRILVLSFIPFMVFFSFKQFAEGLGNTLVAMIITLSANLVNIGFNYLLIFGHGGFPQLKLDGAGYATLISRLIMPLLFFICYCKNDLFKKYLHIALRTKINWKELLSLIKTGVPIALQQMMEVSAFALSAIMAGWIGVIPQASHQIAIGLAGVTFMISLGVSGGTTIRVGHQFGAKNYSGMRRAANASIHLILVFMVFTACMFLCLRHWLPTFYSNDPEVIALTAQLLIMAAIFQLFDGCQVVLLGALRGLADVTHAMYYAFIAYFIVNIPLSYLFAFTFGFGTMGIWAGFVFGLGTACLLFYRRFNKLSILYASKSPSTNPS